MAFNDHAPGTIGVTTSSNATTWNIMGNAPGSVGALRDIVTGTNLPVTVTITRSGTVVASPTAANPSPGTPLYNVFNGYVDFLGAGDADAAVQVTGTSTVTYTFTGLKTNRLYGFKGSAVRGGVGSTYPQRWSLFQITGALFFTNAHTAGAYTNGLANNEVAINTGVNTNGDMADWESIALGPSGSFAVTTTQYTNTIPGGGTANGPYCYALSGLRLQEYTPPTLVSASAVGNNAIQVIFSMPVQPASATNLANYSLTNSSGSVAVLSASFVNDAQTIQLTTASLAPYSTNTLTVNRVADATTGVSTVPTNSQVVFTSVPFTLGYIQRQLYFNVSNGPSVAALTNNPKFPNNPSQVDYPTNMGWPLPNIAINYGGRFSGYLVPPLTGNYYFAIRSDDASQLTLSPNNNPAYQFVVTTEPACCEAFDAHTNGPFTLLAGQRYYIEGLMKQNLGGDYFYVAWKTPTNLTWNVIPGSALGNYLTGSNATLTIQQQPTNTTVMASRTATLAVAATGSSSVTTSPSYQWQLNGFDIPGATAATYTTPVTHPGDNGSVFRVLVAVPGKAQFSSNAVLTVTPDIVPPTVVRAFNLGPTNLQIVYSKPVEPASSTAITNYVFTNGLPVTGASLDATFTNVTLTTAPMVFGSNYAIVINRVRDQAAAPNTIATNTLASFLAMPFAPQDIGNPPLPSSVTLSSNGVNVVSAGSDVGGFSDQFSFSYQIRAGDFDVSARLAGLALSDIWAKAGLMARETLDPGSRFAAALTTPSLNGSYFAWRDPAYSAPASTGNFPANYPNTWLRLKRVGNLFTGYGSYDGQTWTPLGSATITMPAQIYFGLAASSHNSTQPTLAQFCNIADTSTNAVVGTQTNPHEPIGPCSRLTPVVISEIMYKPAPRADTNNLEFLELYNSNPYYQDISGYQVVCADMNYTFPPGTVLASGAYLVIAASPGSIQAIYGITNLLGPYTGSLKKSETVQLLDERGAVLLTVPYSNVSPWPVSADGTGHSLVLANPSYGEGDARAWDISDVVGGSPGNMEAFRPSPLRNVVINEFLAHSDPPYYDFIELYNHANQPADISGCILTDDPTTNKFIIPAGTVIPAGGFISFSQAAMNFGLGASGATIYFKNPDQSRILDTVQYGGQGHNVSTGRWPDGAGEFYRLTTPTPGAPNTNILLSDVVINELMYDPISGNDDGQYVELYNRSPNPVNLGGWQLADAIGYTFPTNTILASGGYLVVARNAAYLQSIYPNLNTTNCLGNFSGKLSHHGEHLALTMPATIHLTNTVYIPVNDLTYGTGGRWGQWSHGGGSSLELINPNVNNRLAYNWADSDETRKSVWTNLEFTGVLDNGSNYTNGPVNLVQLGLLDVGECLVDNIEVRPGGTNGANIIANSDFETGLTNWTPQGDHVRSSLETASGLGGYQSSQSLHLRSSDSVWTLGDYAQGMFTQTTLGPGQTATLRLKARWLAGWPELLMRLRGNWLEVSGAMPVPVNLGTPGMPNSRYVPNAGPAIYEVKHAPAIPPANQPVVVTARFHDFNPFQATLLYRLDSGVNPTPTYTAVPMVDDGTGGDALAGDGLYSATIPGQTNGAVVAFLVQARDIASGSNTLFPADLHNNAGVPRECVVAFGDPIPTGSFKHHHVFITQNWAQRWAQGGGVSHEVHDGTWVDCGGRIIYDWMGRYAGSPYHQYLGSPVTTIGGMHWLMPEDDQVFGTTSFNKQHVPGNGPLDDNTLQREQAAFWMARQIGLPVQNRRFYVYYVNGVRHAPLMEDAQVPGAEMLKEYFPNDNNGLLYKNHAWFEGDITQQANAYMNFNNKSWCLLGRFTTTINGVTNLYKLARYRWMWWIRQFPDSANNFSDVFALIDAANTPTNLPAYYANMESQVDTEEWLRLSAMEHATGDWDSFFTQNQWNMYCYKPTMGKWTALKWDWNITLGSGTATWPPDGSKLFTTGANDPVMATFQNYPAYRRAYLRALQDIANLAMNNAVVNPMLDAKYAAFVANGLTTTAYNGLTVQDPAAPGGLESWIGTMHNSLLTALTNQGVGNVPFALNPTVLSNNVALVSGTAPVAVKTIWINGIPYPVTWTSVTNWLITVPLVPGLNPFNISGVDLHGQPVPGATNLVTVSYAGTAPSPVGQVLINELMYNPTVPNAQYIELYNSSTNITFDLSGWQFQGLDYTFPQGSLLAPNSFLMLVANPSAFSAAYGGKIPIFDTFNAPLQSGGQTLVLVRPGTNTASNLAVAGVRFASAPPWPPGANGFGSSLQLIDPSQDNWRPANWAGNFPPAALSPGTSSTVLASLPAFPPLWINELQADNLTGITNSAGQRTPWLELYNPSTNIVSLSGLYLANNYTNLTAWAFPSGASINPGEFKVIFADSQTNLSTLAELHTSFTLASGSGSLALSGFYNSQPQVLDYVDYANLGLNHSYGSFPDGQSFYRQEFLHFTPGVANDGTTFPSAIAYAGSVYQQDFNTLPNPGLTSTNAGNPVTINGITYSLANPYDFAFPSVSSGNTGGLGIPALAGWYGWSQLISKFGATDGDQTTGGQISFGPPNSTNRALGLLATTSTGATAFGAKFINKTTNVLHYINLQVTGEIWRQSDKAKTLEFYYLIDPAATNVLTTNYTAFLPALNVNFPTVPADVGGVPVDGTSPANQTNLSVTTQVITNWPPGAALWLVWEMPDSGGKAQGLAIDNLSFSAAPSLPNTAPVLALISDRLVILGQTLTFTASATDTDQPPETITFTLGPGAPGGAGINPSSGLFIWTPPSAPTTNAISIIATDNGTPSLSATQSFSVTVFLPPQLQNLSLNGTQFTFSWPSLTTQTYQVEYSTNLITSNWAPLGAPVSGTGTLLSFTNTPATSSPHFFRLRILP